MNLNSSNLCETYAHAAAEDKRYYDIFFSMCRKFHIDWASATEKERAFITEVTRVTYERDLAVRSGTSADTVHPAFSA